MLDILIIDRDRRRLARACAVVEFLEHRPHAVADAAELGPLLDGPLRPAAALVTREDGEAAGAGVLSRLAEQAPELPVFLLDPGAGPGAQPPVELRCRGIPQAPGVLGALSLPLRRPELEAALRVSLEHNRISGTVSGAGQWREADEARELRGCSHAVEKLRKELERAAASDEPVLVSGERGTGRDTAARFVHRHSARRSGPFVPLDCGAHPEEVLERELFGYERGAFPGATVPAPGRISLARGGTLFLDRVENLGGPLQARLLRLLERPAAGEAGRRAGSAPALRLVAGSERGAAGAAGGGVQANPLGDLSVLRVEIPPLRARTEDVPVLADAVIRSLEERGLASLQFSPDALGLLTRYPWPGNFQELCNTVERLALRFPCRRIGPADLPEKLRQPAGDGVFLTHPAPACTDGGLHPSCRKARDWAQGAIDLRGLLADLEMHLIAIALQRSHGVVAQAAKLLGLRRTTLVEKLRKYGLARPEEAAAG